MLEISFKYINCTYKTNLHGNYFKYMYTKIKKKYTKIRFCFIIFLVSKANEKQPTKYTKSRIHKNIIQTFLFFFCSQLKQYTAPQVGQCRQGWAPLMTFVQHPCKKEFCSF